MTTVPVPRQPSQPEASGPLPPSSHGFPYAYGEAGYAERSVGVGEACPQDIASPEEVGKGMDRSHREATSNVTPVTTLKELVARLQRERFSAFPKGRKFKKCEARRISSMLDKSKYESGTV